MIVKCSQQLVADPCVTTASLGDGMRGHSVSRKQPMITNSFESQLQYPDTGP